MHGRWAYCIILLYYLSLYQHVLKKETTPKSINKQISTRGFRWSQPKFLNDVLYYNNNFCSFRYCREFLYLVNCNETYHNSQTQLVCNLYGDIKIYRVPTHSILCRQLKFYYDTYEFIIIVTCQYVKRIKYNTNTTAYKFIKTVKQNYYWPNVKQ